MENPKYHLTISRTGVNGMERVVSLEMDQQVWQESLDQPELLRQLIETQLTRLHG